MSLTCSCDYEPEPGDVCWNAPGDYKQLDKKLPRKCCSCGEKIRLGEICCEVQRYKIPDTDIECRIYGEDGEIPRAAKHMCERCSDIAHSLLELGFCPKPWEDQRELLSEYVDMYGRKSA